MSIHPGQLREHVIRPTLKSMGLYSHAAEELLMLTAATESLGGRYLHQVGGPALGIYQMEPATCHDIYDNYLKYRPELAKKVALFGDGYRELPGNLYYATAMARIHYLRRSEPLPPASDVRGLANYWKQYYNTHLGAGTVKQAIGNYKRYGATT